MLNLKLSYSLKSDMGTRDEQQDYALCYYEGGCFAAVVCDGMGGLSGGILAAKCAATTFIELVKSRDKAEDVSSFFLRMVDILDEKVSSLKDASGEKLNAGTTLVAVLIEKEKLYWLSVGDSRLYLMRNNELIQATRDHNYSLLLNSIQPGDTASVLRKDALISFIGMGGIRIMDISKNSVSLVENDMILLTTDGLFKSLTDSQIKSVLVKNNNTEKTSEELLALAKKNSPISRDNITLVFTKIKGELL